MDEESSLKNRQERLTIDLRDKSYREQYATSTLIENVSAQVQALRRQRGLTQEELAARAGTKQPRISYVEVPPEGVKLPNWEVDTLNRIAQAMGTRLKITFETYGSLVQELDSVTSDSLRRPDVPDDPALFSRPAMPVPDPNAPERTRWMQELMIPWLWDDKLEIGTLAGWLQGRGLPPVGHDEDPYQWLLRGISVGGTAQQFLEKRFAERLAILLGEQPDVEPIVSGGAEEFLINLYWTCAGLSQPGFLAEQLWLAYKRLKHTKLSGAVRDALQGALVHNQFGETKPLKEIWEPMIERGRQRWLRGGEIVGYEGILVRHRTVKNDLEKVFWALGRISQRWEAGDAEQQVEFKRLIGRIPDLVQPTAIGRLIEYARTPGSGWAGWAKEVLPLPVVETRSPSDAVMLEVQTGEIEFRAIWRPGEPTQMETRHGNAPAERLAQGTYLPGPPRTLLLANELLTGLGNAAQEAPKFALEALLTSAVVWRFIQRIRHPGPHISGPLRTRFA